MNFDHNMIALRIQLEFGSGWVRNRNTSINPYHGHLVLQIKLLGLSPRLAQLYFEVDPDSDGIRIRIREKLISIMTILMNIELAPYQFKRYLKGILIELGFGSRSLSHLSIRDHDHHVLQIKRWGLPQRLSGF